VDVLVFALVDVFAPIGDVFASVFVFVLAHDDTVTRRTR
jgi:hypothetical protein